MAYYIAIDGGGTKTEAVLCTGDGGIICRTLAGSTNPNDVGAAESGAREGELTCSISFVSADMK